MELFLLILPLSHMNIEKCSNNQTNYFGKCILLGYRIYVDIMTEENCRQFANIDIIYWSVCTSSRKGGDGVQWLDQLISK